MTGHSDLTTSSRILVTRVLRRELAHHRDTPLVGVSCLAPGTDQLFAAVVLELGGRLEVVLPAPDYRERKISGPDAVLFDQLLAAASSVRFTGFERSCRPAYLAASAAMLSCVDTVLAVWDGRPATRLGSTGDVVDAASKLALPLTVLWPPGARRLSAAAVIPAPEKVRVS
ncbi:MAG TPA: hypothetical protein VH008_02310 [Pseudonocardia sp.]|nr:hypothetical protein [Pseudonocardia sp.]